MADDAARGFTFRSDRQGGDAQAIGERHGLARTQLAQRDMAEADEQATFYGNEFSMSHPDFCSCCPEFLNGARQFCLPEQLTTCDLLVQFVFERE